ncbi:dehydration-responsive element-binding protein 1B-like [Durio zibethinus]|uniref:Dehydration-responsive element-binding protein 1B-like n=1 Tax=Durio zibethinus TaxID=66656 RepID=A0A6P6AQT9_DURZI|nr:dehydration-responsive element-binding protein 1B-like [Durio zibethinus]
MKQREDQQSVLFSKSLQSPCSSLQLDLDSSLRQVETQYQKRKAGRKKFQETRHPVYKGVRRRNGEWVSKLQEPNNESRIWRGTFSSPGMTARAYAAAALALEGDTASLNFPEPANTLPLATSSSSSSVTDIQCAAMEAAEAFGDVDAKTSSTSTSISLLPPPLSCSKNSENVEGSSKMLFMDEEEVFNMPGILDSMAEGLILTPPAMQKGYYWDDDDDDDSMEFTLWGD